MALASISPITTLKNIQRKLKFVMEGFNQINEFAQNDSIEGGVDILDSISSEIHEVIHILALQVVDRVAKTTLQVDNEMGESVLDKQPTEDTKEIFNEQQEELFPTDPDIIEEDETVDDMNILEDNTQSSLSNVQEQIQKIFGKQDISTMPVFDATKINNQNIDDEKSIPLATKVNYKPEKEMDLCEKEILILEMLRDAKDWASFSDIGLKIKLSRVTITKYLKQLKDKEAVIKKEIPATRHKGDRVFWRLAHKYSAYLDRLDRLIRANRDPEYAG